MVVSRGHDARYFHYAHGIQKARSTTKMRLKLEHYADQRGRRLEKFNVQQDKRMKVSASADPNKPRQIFGLWI